MTIQEKALAAYRASERAKVDQREAFHETQRSHLALWLTHFFGEEAQRAIYFLHQKTVMAKLDGQVFIWKPDIFLFDSSDRGHLHLGYYCPQCDIYTLKLLTSIEDLGEIYTYPDQHRRLCRECHASLEITP